VSVRYPIAKGAQEALRTPIGRAVREREAARAAGAPVEFVREATGPFYASREAAEAAYAGLVDVAGSAAIAPEDRYCELIELAEPVKGRPPRAGQAEPEFREGRRWPAPKRRLRTQWRLTVGYWRPVDPHARPALPQARAARKSEEPLDAAALRAMAGQPLQPVKPQQPLDIGLFEVRPPEAPHIVMPDD
jgi:hypothetical protein